MPTQILTKLLPRFLIAALLAASFTAHGAVQQRFLQVTGTNGETGSGSFYWDDSVVPDGDTLTENNIIAISITISGGAFATPQSYDLSDCFYVRARPTPTFETELTFSCDNRVEGVGENFIAFGLDSNQSILGNHTGVLTWTIGDAPSPVAQPIPSLTAWASVLLAALMTLFVSPRARGTE